MRLSKTFEIGQKRKVTVKELRFKEIRFVLKQMAANGEANISIEEIFTTRLDEFEEVINAIVVFPQGETIDDLSFSELELVYEKSKEVNPAFLGVMKRMGFMAKAEDAENGEGKQTEQPDSTELPLSSSSADT